MKKYLIDVYDNKQGYLKTLDDEYETEEEAEEAAREYERLEKYHWNNHKIKFFDYCEVSELNTEDD